MRAGGAWQEVYEGGSPEAERQVIEQLARDILRLQSAAQRSGGGSGQRAFYGRPLLCTEDATLTFHDGLPPAMRSGFAQPGASYPTIVRFSYASSPARARVHGGPCGVALRVKVSGEESHDLLHQRARQPRAQCPPILAFASAMSGNGLARFLGRLALARDFGIGEARRMLSGAASAGRGPTTSLALQSYWSCGAIRWGDQAAVRYSLRPQVRSAQGGDLSPDRLQSDLARRLRQDSVAFDLCVQPFLDRPARRSRIAR